MKLYQDTEEFSAFLMKLYQDTEEFLAFLPFWPEMHDTSTDEGFDTATDEARDFHRSMVVSSEKREPE